MAPMATADIPLPAVLIATIGGVIGPMLWLRDRIEARHRGVQKALPYALDLITLCVEAGLTLQSALGHAVAKGPPGALRDGKPELPEASETTEIFCIEIPPTPVELMAPPLRGLPARGRHGGLPVA